MRSRFGQIFNNNHALSSIFVSEEGAIIIDTAETNYDAKEIHKVLKENNIFECTIFFTHGHTDHIKAFEELSRLCEKDNIAIRKIITDERNLKIPFLTKIIENYLVKEWQKHNVYNGIELTEEKIDLYFSEHSNELTKAEIKAIRDCSMFLAKNENAKHVPIEEQYIIKAYLLNKPFGDIYKEYKKDARKKTKNKDNKAAFIHRAVEWAKWKNDKNHMFDRFAKIPYNKKEPYTIKEFKQNGYKITAISINSEKIKRDDRGNIGPLYFVEDNKTKLKTVITGDLPKEMQERIFDYVEKDKKLIKLFANVDVLQIPHHGSKNNYSEKFIEMINPKVSVIPEIRNNKYDIINEFDENILEKLENKNLPTFVTGDYGNIKFSKDKELLFVKTETLTKKLNDYLEEYDDEKEQNRYSILGNLIRAKGFAFTSNDEDKKIMTEVIKEFDFGNTPIRRVLKNHFDFFVDISTRNLDFSRRTLREEFELALAKAKKIFKKDYQSERNSTINEMIEKLEKREKFFKEQEEILKKENKIFHEKNNRER